ncbi:MAG: fibrobacter succinogenes major paralogous domain-containing protein [Candidatus Saccharibacteria bacterium]|nr:fibrobacter succinogenes major paralogous domain-containing protein [Candidatus Saccharibacteria bacterium]
MDPENTQKPEENSRPVTPPPYMPPIEVTASVEPPKQSINNPAEPPVPPTTTNPAKLNLKTEVPSWGWAVAAVIIVGIVGFVGWRIYSVNEANRMISRSSGQSQSDTFSQANNTMDTTPADTNNLPTTVDNSVANTATITIGSQVWMKYNMNVGSLSVANAQFNNKKVEKGCYNIDETNCDNYGGLYGWDEAMQYSVTDGAQGICPVGFHIPTDNEFTTLINYLGGIASANSKLSFGGSSGFDGRFGGYFSNGSSHNQFFADYGDATYFWSSTQYGSDEESSDFARVIGLYANEDGVNRGVKRDAFEKSYNLAVRCIKN